MTEKIFVAGHRGMVGGAILRQLKAAGAEVITRTHAELDLTNQAAVDAFFASEKPSQVYLAAAKVGGIYANNTYPAEFIYKNLMIQANVIQDTPEDFVIATGVQYTVRQFISWSAEHLGITLRFEGTGVDEVAIVAAIKGDNAPALKVGDVIVKIDPRYFRPAEVETLLGDPSKAKQKLG